MKLYVVKSLRSIMAGPLPKETADEIAQGLNIAYQSDEYIVEEFDADRFAKGFNFRLVDGL